MRQELPEAGNLSWCERGGNSPPITGFLFTEPIGIPWIGFVFLMSTTRVFCPQIFRGPGWSLLAIQIVIGNKATQRLIPPHPPCSMFSS